MTDTSRPRPTPSASTSLRPSSSKETDLQRELPASLRPTRLEFSSLRPFEPTTLASLPDLLHAIPAPVYASKLSAKLVPLSNPPRPSAAAATKAKAKARREADGVRRKTVGLLSRAEGKRQSVWAPKAGEVRHAQLAPLADLWLAYVRELLGLADQTASLRLDGNNLVEGNIDALLGKLAKAEFVGATLTVKSAPNQDLVGVHGIVVHETANTFKLVTAADKVKVVPKDHTVFSLSIPLPSIPPSYHPPPPPTPSASSSTASSSSSRAPPPLPPPAPAPASPSTTPSSSAQTAHLQLDLYGAQFRFRSADRAGRKFKTHGKTEMAGSAGMKL